MRPSPASYPAYFNTYIKLVADENIVAALENQFEQAIDFFNQITEEQSHYQYAEDKWTIRQVMQHISDAERIFCYRALAFARNDQSILPSFDENSYAAHSNGYHQKWGALVSEFGAVRNATIALFRSFNEAQFHASGKVNDYQISVLALAYTTVGHTAHHINIIRERYLDL